MRRTVAALSATLILGILVGGCSLLQTQSDAPSPSFLEPSYPPRSIVLPSPQELCYDDRSGTAVSCGPRVYEGPLPSWPADKDGIVLEVDIYEGFERAEVISIDKRGWVVRAAQDDVFSSVDDYTTWRMDKRELRRLLTMIDDSGLHTASDEELGDKRDAAGAPISGGISPSNDTIFFRFADGNERSVTLAKYGEHVPRQDRLLRQRLWNIGERIANAARTVRHLAAPPQPWVPSQLAILAGPPSPSERSGMPPNRPPYRSWPLRQSIRQLSTEIVPNAYDEPVHSFCLTGDDAAAVFAMLTGVNHAYLRVDDGRHWELDVEVRLPTDTLPEGPCA